MSDYARLRGDRFVSDVHELSGAVPEGWCLRNYVGGPVPGNCMAILSPPDSEYPDISVRQVTGRFATLDDLVQTTRNLIATRQCIVMTPETDTTVDGLPGRELHYRDGDLEICKVFVIRNGEGFSFIGSAKTGFDKDHFHRFVRTVTWGRSQDTTSQAVSTEYSPFRTVPAFFGFVAGLVVGLVFKNFVLGLCWFFAIGLGVRCALAFLTPTDSPRKCGIRTEDITQSLILIFILDGLYLALTWYFNDAITAMPRLDKLAHALAWLLGILTVVGVGRVASLKRRG